MKVLISESFKALRRGEFVRADEKHGEFIFDSSNCTLDVVVLKEIAEVNGLQISGKKKSELIASLETAIAEMNLQEVNKMTDSQKAIEIVKQCHAAGKTEDETLVELVQSGIKFAHAQKYFKQAQEQLGLVVGKKDVLEKVSAALGENFAPQTSEEVEAAITHITKNDENISDKQAQQAIRAYLKSREREMPKRVKQPKEKAEKAPRVAAWGGHNTKVYDWILANTDFTEEQLVEALPTLGKKIESEKDRKKFVQRYTTARELVRRARAAA